jgi:hypothetical protein
LNFIGHLALPEVLNHQAFKMSPHPGMDMICIPTDGHPGSATGYIFWQFRELSLKEKLNYWPLAGIMVEAGALESCF